MTISTILQDQEITSLYRAGKFGVLWQALQARLNPQGAVRVSRWIAGLLLLDVDREIAGAAVQAERDVIKTELAGLAELTPDELTTLMLVLDEIGWLIYEWFESGVLSEVVETVQGGV